MHGYNFLFFQLVRIEKIKAYTSTYTTKRRTRSRSYRQHFTLLFVMLIIPIVSIPAFADLAQDHAIATKKAIALVGIRAYMTEITRKEQANYPVQKSVYETIVSSTYAANTNTRTTHVILVRNWNTLFAKAYGKNTVDKDFIRKKLQDTYAKYNCSYPPTRLLLDEGVRLNYQYIANSSYLFTVSYSLEDCKK